MVTSLSRQDTPTGAVWPVVGAGRRAGLRAGGATCAGGLVLTGLVTLLGPASGIVILTVLLLAAPLAWRRRRRQHQQPAAPATWPTECLEELPTATPLPPLLTPEALSTPELCLA